MLMALQKRNKKIRGLGLQLDAMGWIIVVMIIAGVVLGAVYQLRESSRVASTQTEMAQIRTAVMLYKGSRFDGASPTSLDVLQQEEAIPASESIDGLPHGKFLPSSNNRWSSAGQIVDMWGSPYVLTTDSDGVCTLTSNGSGKELSISF
jgi:type II secretory pathway pseudopilin PulG